MNAIFVSLTHSLTHSLTLPLSHSLTYGVVAAVADEWRSGNLRAEPIAFYPSDAGRGASGGQLNY